MNINNKIGIYPGTFDPITFGHLDIIKRACKLVDKLIVGVAENVNKHTTFNIKLRTSMAENEVKGAEINADVISFNGLLVKFAKEQNASVIIRGLRAVSDFDYEFQMSWVNYKLSHEIETIFLPASEDTQFISSSFVKEIARLGEDVSSFVSQNVQTELINLNRVKNGE
ncbi:MULTISPECIES: pantetheine-phosphate adenylyltransferase [Wolbachia]|uniref:pantetheine-phosphate adenylyltransferase n=1 Tax=Wolbachia TaxID=953 RepID=UPI0002D251D7|nr:MULTISPECIES: pantetheine-phosphate adenylyltransferase [Rickettsiales]AGJ98549.1 Phosphopantetheine adenylyltransferase [Wolbachia endosymbiont of Drosophila simulans wNo]QCB62651.1 pantetheine-phosphate adenylyltransferase [Wolbachia endosymbiont of Drosophila mauritiana]QCB63697.1 pantetheine-phosphate adenylyltransferase [Wolbachia endosymbiont of Drosophila mauritiana]QUI60644.1 pantetheine-phosphate adenylyltransferase [Wolbachia endosymbiont of Spodoptera picta]QWE33028.1 Phosphopant